MLFSLLLANITILLCLLFLFLVVFNNFFFFFYFNFFFFFLFYEKIENTKLKLDLTIPTGAPITVANDATDKAINDLSK